MLKKKNYLGLDGLILVTMYSRCTNNILVRRSIIEKKKKKNVSRPFRVSWNKETPVYIFPS